MLAAVLIAVTMAAFVGLGYEVAVRRLRGGIFEVLAAATCVGAMLWIASVWTLALLHLLNRPAVVARTAVVAGLALLFLVLRLRRAAAATLESNGPVLLLAAPVVAWAAFVAWRATVVPPLSHDALAYHLPRAVLWIREGGYRVLDLPLDPRLRLLPANYEMLLADVMLLGGGDGLTEWVATFFYLAFCVLCGAFAQRWWRAGGMTAAATLVLSAAVPVLLLHAGADKNDVMVAFFVGCALLWGGRWFADRDVPSLVLTVLSASAAAGTKPQGLILAGCIAPLLLSGLGRAPRPGTFRLAGGVVCLLAAALLLGGWFYVSTAAGTVPQGQPQRLFAWGDWENLWQAPWVLLTAPFSPWSEELFVPWSVRPWFWGRDEIYFSHLGIPFVLAVVLLPPAIRRFHGFVDERTPERLAVSAVALAVFLLMLPVRDVPMPHGIYVTALPRYVLFLVPVVFGLTFAPTLETMRLARRSTAAVSALLVAWFLAQAFQAAADDRFVPPDYVLWASRNRGTRVIPFDARRAASVADRLAGETEPVAMDAGYGAWIQPAFGPSLRRPVSFVEPGPGAPAIPPDAKWVVVDRGFRIIWQHPGFRDLSQWRTLLTAGSPDAEDTRVLRWLSNNPDFEPVYVDGRMNQAVFRRR